MKTSFHSLEFALARQVFISLALVATALADNHPPVALNDSITVTESRTINVAATRLLLNDTDADGDALAVMTTDILSARGSAVSFANNVIHYTPPAGYVGLDSFGYTIIDGHGGTASAQVSVLVASANLPSQNVVGITALPGGLRVRFAGAPGYAYIVQRSADLNVWTTVATRTAPFNVIFEYLDADPPPGVVFYRAILP